MLENNIFFKFKKNLEGPLVQQKEKKNRGNTNDLTILL